MASTAAAAAATGAAAAVVTANGSVTPVGLSPQALLASLRGLSPASKSLVMAIIVGGIYFGGKSSGSKGKKDKKELRDKDGKIIPRKREQPFGPRLMTILKLLFRGRDKNVIIANLSALTIFLVLRTLLSIQVAVVTGQVAQNLVQQKWEDFLSSVAKFALIGIPAAFVNSGLKYCTAMMSLRFRRQLTDFINKQYIVGVNFYKANQLPDTKIENVDQRVTADVEAFCEQLSNLYTSIFKPFLDIVLNTLKLSSVMGANACTVFFMYYIVLAKFKMAVLRAVNLKENTQLQSELQGDYRTAHSRLITYAEEIAFFEGSAREQTLIFALFDKLFRHTAKVNKIQGMVGIIDQYLIKYGSSITGYALLCLPVFFPRTKGERTVADLTRDYVLNRQLLMDLASGIAVLIGTTTKVSSFMGITSRVSEVLERVKMLKDPISSNFKVRANEEKAEVNAAGISAEEMDRWLALWRQRGEEQRSTGIRTQLNRIRVSASAANLARLQAEDDAKAPIVREVVEGEEPAGVIKEGEIIRFIDADIVSPDGRLLVKDLNLDVPIGTNIMITGPNGCGKSSLFRVLGELWPPHKGVVQKPFRDSGDLVFVPQRPYLVMGTLRDQIIYPHSVQQMKELGVTDDDLTRLLDVVDPARSIVNEWKYDDVRNWSIALSGGQKQRVAMARVFYHRPKYAILDECTSAVSSEVEGKIYATCRLLRITLFTVSHRAQLQQYHEYQLRLNGHGGWQYLTRKEVEGGMGVDLGTASKILLGK